MRVTDLRVYPVKSLGGTSVESAKVEPQGLADDRRWGLIEPDGGVVTARECHGLLRLTAEMIDDGILTVTDRADGESIRVSAPLAADPVPISMSGLASATPADSAASSWISTRVGRELRLAWLSDPTARPISAAHGGQPGDVVSMADTGPLLLTSESSLRQVNDWIAVSDPDSSPLDMVRFRPNVVVDSPEAFTEDTWGHVRIGSVDFRTTELCDRCVMTTLDPVTLDRGKEPIRTLAQHRRWNGATWFGIRLVPEMGGSITLGGEVTPSTAHVG